MIQQKYDAVHTLIIYYSKHLQNFYSFNSHNNLMKLVQ